MTHTYHPDPPRMAEAMKAEILRDMASGRVPADAPSYSDLHDYVDANEYALSAAEACQWSEWDFECQRCADTFNTSTDLVDAWLRERATKEPRPVHKTPGACNLFLPFITPETQLIDQFACACGREWMAVPEKFRPECLHWVPVEPALWLGIYERMGSCQYAVITESEEACREAMRAHYHDLVDRHLIAPLSVIAPELGTDDPLEYFSFSITPMTPGEVSEV